MKARNLFLIISLLVLFLFLPSGTVHAKTLSGKCGKQARWIYNTKSKNLTIKGKGAVNKKIILTSPNSNGTYQVNVLKICKGITDISSDQPFSEITCRNKILLPKSITRLRFGALVLNHATSKITIVLPKALKKIETGAFFSGTTGTISKIYLDPQNKYYCVKKNVIFTKNQKKLIYYPSDKEGTTYKIPKSVSEIHPLAFSGNTHLKKVILPKKIRKIGAGAFFCCTNLTHINLKSNTKINQLPDYDDTHTRLWRSEYTSPTHSSDALSLLLDYNDTNTKYSRLYHFGVFEGTSLKSIVIPNRIKSLPPDTFASTYFCKTVTLIENTDCVYIPIPLESITIGANFIGNINTGNKPYTKNSLMLYDRPVKKFIVSKKNSKYCSENNNLLSKDKTVLYQAGWNTTQELYIIPDHIERIACGAFMWHYNPKEGFDVQINHNMESIDNYAFFQSGINGLYLNGHVKRIGKASFAYTSLRVFKSTFSIDYIDDFAFACNDYLQYVTLSPFTIQGKSPFYGCFT